MCYNKKSYPNNKNNVIFDRNKIWSMGVFWDTPIEIFMFSSSPKLCKAIPSPSLSLSLAHILSLSPSLSGCNSLTFSQLELAQLV